MVSTSKQGKRQKWDKYSMTTAILIIQDWMALTLHNI